MGQGQSADISPPWIPALGKRYPKGIEQAIIDLAQSEQCFVAPADSDERQTGFALDDHYDEIEAVVQFDNQLALQAEKLVPSRVTEQQFWSNYFSHVNSLRAKGDAILAESEAAKADSDNIAVDAVAEESAIIEQNIDNIPAQSDDSATSANDIENHIATFLTAGSELVPLPKTASQMRWGIIGGISEALCESLSISKLSTVVGVVGSLSPRIKKKLKDYSHSTELITSTDIDAVYIGECSTDLDCIELCKLALQHDKHCLVHSFRTFCTAYALSQVDSQSCISALWPITSFSPRISLLSMLLAKDFLGSVGNIVYQFSIPSLELRQILPSNCSPFEWAAAPVLHILDIVFGPLLNVQGYAKCVSDISDLTPFEDSAVFHFHIGSGATGCATFNFNSNAKEDRLLVDGSRGRISFPIFGEGIPEICINGDAIKVPDAALSATATPTKENRFLRSFVEGCESGRSSSLFQRQKRVGKLIDVILRSYYGDRHDFFWTRPDSWDFSTV